MSQKVKIEINQETFEKINKIYEQSKDAYMRMNLNSIDDFISYILENFSNSSLQFEKLNDQMKSLMENINLENLNFEDLFKNIAKSSQKKVDNSSENQKKEDKKDNNDLDKIKN